MIQPPNPALWDSTDVRIRLTRRPSTGQVRYDVHVQGPSDVSAEIPDWAPPVADWELETTGLAASDQAVKRLVAPEPRDRLVDIGTKLFSSLFTGRVAALYAATLGPGAQSAAAAALCLRIASDDDAALALPWELLYDPVARNDFLALATGWSVVRELPGGTSTGTGRGEATPPPLRVLVATADRSGTLQVQLDAALLRDVAAGGDRLTVETLPNATAAELRSRLADREAPVDVLHFAGTGRDDAGPDQVLGMAYGPDVSGADLRSMAEASPALRLVVLSACRTDRVAREVARSVPATVGVRSTISADACRSFTDGLFRALAAGASVQAATWSARSRLDRELPGRREWAAVTVYLRGDGRLLAEPRSRVPGTLEPSLAAPAAAAGQDAVAAAAATSPHALDLAVTEADLAALRERSARFEGAVPAVVADRIATLDERLAQLRAETPGRPRPRRRARGAAAVRIARLLDTATRRRRLRDRVLATLTTLQQGGLLAAAGDGDARLLDLLSRWLEDADAIVAGIAGEDFGGRTGGLADRVTHAERLLDDPAWDRLARLDDDATARLALQQAAAIDHGGRWSEWKQVLDEARSEADTAVEVGADCQDELDELAVYGSLFEQARRALRDGAIGDAAVALRRLDDGPALPAPAHAGGSPRPARHPGVLARELAAKSDRGRELLRRSELLLLRTKTARHRSSYMVMIRNPLAGGAQGISIQGSSTLVDQDREYLVGLIDKVTVQHNARAARRVRPVQPDGPDRPDAADAVRAAATPVPQESLERELRDVGDLLYRLVVPDGIQRLLRDTGASLTIATNDLEMPWELIWGGGEHLALTRPVARMPLGHAQPRFNRPRPEGSALQFLLVCSDPFGDLPGAEVEVKELGKALQARQDGVVVDTLIGPEATGRNLNEALRSGQYDVVHYAGHASFDAEDPQMSGLLLHDEELFHAEKIQRLVEGQPLVFLNACETGRTANETEGQTSYIGGPAAGLAAAFLYGGALGCIGSLWPVYDATATRFATDFYNRLIDGALIGEAVRLARDAVRRAFPDQVTWAAYSLNGDPTFRLTRPRRPTRPGETA